MNKDLFINRLKEIIQYYSLTSSTFAERINVPKSSISHLMSGRNKASLDFVLKIIDKFPEVDLYWLLNGEGIFPKSKNEESNSLPPPNIPSTVKKTTDSPSLFSEFKSNDTPKENIQQKKINTKISKKLIKVILFYNDGSFDEFNK